MFLEILENEAIRKVTKANFTLNNILKNMQTKFQFFRRMLDLQEDLLNKEFEIEPKKFINAYHRSLIPLINFTLYHIFDFNSDLFFNLSDWDIRSMQSKEPKGQRA